MFVRRRVSRQRAIRTFTRTFWRPTCLVGTLYSMNYVVLLRFVIGMAIDPTCALRHMDNEALFVEKAFDIVVFNPLHLMIQCISHNVLI